MKLSSKNPNMLELPLARIPEEPGAVIPHAGICEGATGVPTLMAVKGYQVYKKMRQQGWIT
jgi:hypothetical protein